MKISKFRFSTWLFWITVVSMAAYIGYFGYWLMKGQPKIHGQTLLLVEVFIGIIIASLPFFD